MSHWPDSWKRPQPGVSDAQREHWRDEARRGLNRQLATTVLLAIVGAALALGTGLWIGADGNGDGLVVGLQIAGILLGPALVLFALILLPLLLRRRWAVQHRTFVLCPARSAALRWGPFRLTAVRLMMPSDVPSVIFPETLGRSRIRKLIAADGQLLVLLPRDGKLDTLLYAGAGGRPCFTDQPAMASGANSFWERRGAAAIAERGLPAEPG